MKCPECNGGPLRIIDSRPKAEHVRRRRQCENCGHRVNTFELMLVNDGKPRMVKVSQAGRVELDELQQVWARAEGTG